MLRKPSHFRLWSTAAGLALLLATLSACAPRAQDDAIIFMTFGDPAERQAYVDLVAAFVAGHSEINVEIVHIPSQTDYRTRLVTDFAAGQPPDISLMNYRRYASFAARELLEPLGPYLDRSDLISLDDFYEVATEAFTWRGTLTCIPQNISSLVVYYNADLFDVAGLPYPADGWTWDDFLSSAQALTRDLNGDGTVDQYGLGIEPSLMRLAPFIWQNEAPLVDDEAAPTRLTLTRPPAMAAFQWFVDLRQGYGVAPGRQEEAALDSQSRFMAGSTAMLLESRRVTPTLRQISDFRWDVGPLPARKTQAGILHSDAYCLSRAAADKESAWRFIEFANSPEGQRIVTASGRLVPSLRSVAESELFLSSDEPPEHSRVYVDTIPFLRLVPVLSTWQEIEATAGEEIERAFYGEVTVPVAASQAVQRTEEYFLAGERP
jgi:multiple sugar transport system substrate-binding protein